LVFFSLSLSPSLSLSLSLPLPLLTNNDVGVDRISDRSSPGLPPIQIRDQAAATQLGATQMSHGEHQASKLTGIR
jgi:hypothetical protein